MGFELDQCSSRVELVNKFMERMRSTLEEAKLALAKSKDDMARYYDQRCVPALKYQPRDKVYLDASDVSTTWPSRKLSHQHLGPFLIEQKVGNSAYRLRLPAAMKHIHPIFNMVKLTPAPEDPIAGRRAPPQPLLEIVDGEEEWVVEEILDSKVINQKLRYLVKWKDFGVEHNSWESLGTMCTHWNWYRSSIADTQEHLDTFGQWTSPPFTSNLSRRWDDATLRGGWMLGDTGFPPDLQPLYMFRPIDVDSGSPNPDSSTTQ